MSKILKYVADASFKPIIDLFSKLSKYVFIKLSCDIRQSLPLTTTVPHPTGIVIGKQAEIGRDVTIYQNVTIGTNIGLGEYPKIGDNVVVYSGAAIIGDVDIGADSIIGANSVVVDDVPPRSVVAGVPAQIIRLIAEDE